MTVKELINTCSNTGIGRIRIINNYNIKDSAIFNDVSEIGKIPYLYNHKVLNWEFLPQKQIGTIEWEFLLEITI